MALRASSGRASLTPRQIGTRVFFLEGGKTRTGTVQNTETIEVSVSQVPCVGFAHRDSGSPVCHHQARRWQRKACEAAVRTCLPFPSFPRLIRFSLSSVNSVSKAN